MTVHSSGDQFDTILARLRAEYPLEDDAAQQAVQRHEAGLLEEAGGNQAAALEDHQAAFDAYPEFREPLEAMLRLRRHDPNDAEVGMLLDRLMEVAVTPEQSARALWELAGYRQQLQQDVEGALDCLQSAVETSPHDAACCSPFDSPVPTQRTRGSEGAMAMSPMERVGPASSKTAFHVTPLLVVLKIPPVEVAT